MRPLGHLGIGPGSSDYELFETNEVIYDNLSERGEYLLEQLYKEFMCEFSNPPKKSLRELTEELAKQRKKVQRLCELRVFDVIIEHEKNIVNEIETLIANKNFLDHRDTDSIIYKKLYKQREILFYNSDERKNLLQEIFTYNEKCAKELGINLTSLD